ncbi:MAG: BrnA antitoxin family protein [Rhodoferax sp.]|nr:BrnA antitoxin family protein [Rhodoferax sp.]
MPKHQLSTGNKQLSSVTVDPLDAFKATGPDRQTRINAVLRDALAHGVVKP